MPGPLGLNVLQTSGGGLGGNLSGWLSKLGASGGILSTAVGPLQTRLATVQAASTPQAKVQALMGTLGTRLKSGGLLSGFNFGGGTSSHAAPSLQVAGAQRTLGTAVAPAGIQYR